MLKRFRLQRPANVPFIIPAVVACVATCLSAGPALSESPTLAPKAGANYSVESTVIIAIADNQPTMSKRVVERDVLSNDGSVTVIHNNYISYVGPTETQEFVNSPDNYTRLEHFLGVELSTVKRKPSGPGGKPEESARTIIREKCDQVALGKFFPLGGVSTVTVPCSTAITFDGKPQDAQAYELELTYQGGSTLTLPIGVFNVEDIRITRNGSGRQAQTLIRFEPHMGISLVSDTTSVSSSVRVTEHSEVVRLGRHM